MSQVYKLAQVYVRLDLKTTLADSFRAVINKNNTTIQLEDAKIATYDNTMKNNQSIIDNDQVIISVYKGLDKSNKTKIQWLKLQRNGIAVIAIVAIAKIFLFH